MQSEKLNDQEIVRREKLEFFKKNGIESFPKSYTFSDTFSYKKLHKEFDSYSKEQLHDMKISKAIVGRIMTKRSSFLLLKNENELMQVYYPKKEMDQFNLLFDKLDIGDILYVKGSLMKTNTNELTLRANFIKLVTKSLKPLPDKFHGLVDIEEKLRKRYLDLIVNEDSYIRFKTRSKVISAIRNYFESLDYLDVETPILHSYLSGASAKPFTTHHNALDQDFYLRIATEIPLKKLLVGGFNRVYEIGKIFRNEGIDTTHNPEFTSIEFYEAYSNFEGMMEHTEKLIREICQKLNITHLQLGETSFDINKPFKKINMTDAVSNATNVDFKNISLEQAKEIAKKYHIEVKSYYKIGHIINELFELLIEESLIEPTFVTHHPIEVSPLSAKTSDPRFTERAELFINKKEYANMYTELNDPIDQLERFKAQIHEKEAGNDEANDIDWDFITALEYGMPPAGGCGIGIDRLIMLLTNQESIREVLLFPTLKEQNKINK
ncbi:lysine--tRNA ligase [Mycoplasma phocimorsus]|uniref:lysine--tRNA ligase n=1 Tax=Mycoplasma phocimorsus TaxID=3045839 RepID=UPI0024C041F1|nr:lysine--tRNA ligase [Mycoplasma phocimorsus]MDJ1647888.1 lysine--tRNA ligase [Mycoplasma phocimorsus]